MSLVVTKIVSNTIARGDQRGRCQPIALAARQASAVRAKSWLLCMLLAVYAVVIPAVCQAAEPLPEMQLHPDRTTVSGLSSGAYMAVQLHVANSLDIIGAGVVAGGPYFCAQGQLATALNHCMQTFLGKPDSDTLLARARVLADAGRIDPLSGLADDRVYLFSGTRDTTVTRAVMDAAQDFYREAGVKAENIEYQNDLAAGHAFISNQAANACGVTKSPFINNCNYDQAGNILQHLYVALAPPGTVDASRLREFDQTEFLPNPEAHGMATHGFIYTPAACASGDGCSLHIAFAGCKQTPADIDDLYARTAGFNGWAETNRLVILYPQSNQSPGNPNGCWDWWGYDDPAYHTKRGRQMAAVARMAARLGVRFAEETAASFCERHYGWNWSHWYAGRAQVCGWTVCAVGSGDTLGLFYSTSTLYESPEGVFSTSACTP